MVAIKSIKVGETVYDLKEIKAKEDLLSYDIQKW